MAFSNRKRPHTDEGNEGAVAILAGPLGLGGSGKTIVQQASDFSALGLRVDLLVHGLDGPLMGAITPSARRHRLSSLHPLWGVFALAWYLRRSRPHVVVVHRPRLLRPLRRACVLAAHRCRVIAVIHGAVLTQGDVGRGRSGRRSGQGHLRRLKECDAVIAVSGAVARNAAEQLGISPDSLRIAYPPIDRDALRRSAREMSMDVRPTRFLIGVGRLEHEKDFGLLLRAFARIAPVCQDLELVILGEGRERQALTALSGALGIADRVHLPGFQSNPYPWIVRAELLALSSRSEGFGMVLAEALALGVPVVATDCPSGPREILCDGRYGHLVRPGDPLALAEAILATLRNPPDREQLPRAVERFQPAAATKVYLEAMGCEISAGCGQ
jgi:glycosyltransferase involved in cell wall biosynthesis